MAATLSHLVTPQHKQLPPAVYSSHYHYRCDYQPTSISISFLINPSSFHFLPFPLRPFRISHLKHKHSHSFICCLSSNKPSSRKVMSDAELCNSIREFVVSVGLPPDHVPSTKELALHGRKDLANVVRRRGHKFIKELLSSSTETAMEGFDLQKNMNDEESRMYIEETGEQGQVNNMGENSADSLLKDEGSTGNSLQMEFESAIGSDIHSEISRESPPPLDENASDTVQKLDVSQMNDVTDIDDRSMVQYEPAISSDDQNHRPTETLVSLQEKVKNFMQYGHLDTIEDEFGSGMAIDVKEEGEHSTSENHVEDELVFQSDMERRHLGVNNINLGLNGTLMASTLPASDSTRHNLSAQGQTHVDLKDINKPLQVIEVENEDEIDRLKRMLHQKELELSELKEEIEKEKQALLLLQSKAENEISKAQKLISEKDAELHAAEESLSGLVEAKIQYFGDGQSVEVAGSFNGWHQRIKLEPQLSSPTLEAIESRKSRLWSTTLWLYPGVYEIKFIVDGQWKIDPQRESTSKGGIENNILRVDR